MAAVASLYNSLTTLGEAEEHFVNREPTLRALAVLLAQHEYAFGICFIHAHCKLAGGEVMLARGNVSRPEVREHASTLCPEPSLSPETSYKCTVRRN